jgi:hypothetical protein
MQGEILCLVFLALRAMLALFCVSITLAGNAVSGRESKRLAPAADQSLCKT